MINEIASHSQYPTNWTQFLHYYISYMSVMFFQWPGCNSKCPFIFTFQIPPPAERSRMVCCFPTKHCNSSKIQSSTFISEAVFLSGWTCPPPKFVIASSLKEHFEVLYVGHFYLWPVLVPGHEGDISHCFHSFCFTRCFVTALRFLTANIPWKQ